VEDFVGISGEALGLPQLPDGKFLPPMPLSCVERAVRDAMAATYRGERVLTIGVHGPRELHILVVAGEGVP